MNIFKWRKRQKIADKNVAERDRQQVANEFVSHTDVDGSYTGISFEDEFEKPVQDVDDL
ncbi:MAG: hypothetical protein RR348_01895 [Clostridia bacterium]